MARPKDVDPSRDSAYQLLRIICLLCETQYHRVPLFLGPPKHRGLWQVVMVKYGN